VSHKAQTQKSRSNDLWSTADPQSPAPHRASVRAPCPHPATATAIVSAIGRTNENANTHGIYRDVRMRVEGLFRRTFEHCLQPGRVSEAEDAEAGGGNQ
jgi:hypothetical protein